MNYKSYLNLLQRSVWFNYNMMKNKVNLNIGHEIIRKKASIVFVVVEEKRALRWHVVVLVDFNARVRIKKC